jgi:hypothetical protein
VLAVEASEAFLVLALFVLAEPFGHLVEEGIVAIHNHITQVFSKGSGWVLGV